MLVQDCCVLCSMRLVGRIMDKFYILSGCPFFGEKTRTALVVLSLLVL